MWKAGPPTGYGMNMAATGWKALGEALTVKRDGRRRNRSYFGLQRATPAVAILASNFNLTSSTICKNHQNIDHHIVSISKPVSNPVNILSRTRWASEIPMARSLAPPIPSRKGSPPSAHSGKSSKLLKKAFMAPPVSVYTVAYANFDNRIGVKAMVEKVRYRQQILRHAILYHVMVSTSGNIDWKD